MTTGPAARRAITISSGRIAALPAVPVGWSVLVENLPSGQANASGGILIGAATLDPSELTGLAVVEAYEPGAWRFEVTLVLRVTADFDHQRRVVVPKGQLDLRPR